MKNTNAITPVYSNLPAHLAFDESKRAGQANVTWNGIYSYEYLDSKDELFLERAINLFLKNLEYSNTPNTHYCYSRDLHYLLEKIGNIKLSSISEEVLQDCIDQIKNCGIKKPVHSASTMNRAKSVYRSFFKWCFKKNTSVLIWQVKFVS
ncbi:MAG: hypothetical protein HZA74_02875 [Ignavibacteriales bacterium]|nr:hypothetical protein [Ignavibacteriales bacterium]